MADNSKIEWTEATWNPTVGCSVLTPGCTNCYAMKMAARLEAMGQPIYAGMTKPSKAGAVWTGQVELSNWGQVIKPLSWKRPRRIFVNSMSDLFHEILPDETIDKVFAVMALCPQHTFQVLTKRAERMREYLSEGTSRVAVQIRIATQMVNILADSDIPRLHVPVTEENSAWPLPNVWLGVSCERQQEADERIPHLLQTPAAIRFVSAEPLLGPIDLTHIRVRLEGESYMTRSALYARDPLNKGSREYALDWIIVGGESGHGARPFNIEWADQIVAQCKADGVACFVKQLGAVPLSDGYPMELKSRKGGDENEWPERLRVRQFPQAA